MIIREAIDSDYIFIENILFSSFLSKFQKLLSLPEKEIYSFLKTSWILSVTKNCKDYIVEEDSIIMGVIRLNILHKDFKNEISIKKHFNFVKIYKKLWFIKMIKFLCAVMILSSNNSKGKCYIEHIAVWEAARWKWVWTKLLEYWEKIATQYNQNKYTLYVAGDNRAKKLYERLGFRIIYQENSILTQYLFWYQSWFYMGKNLQKNSKRNINFDTLWFLWFFGFIFFLRWENVWWFFIWEHGNYFVLLNFLWLLFFMYFIPRND